MSDGTDPDSEDEDFWEINRPSPSLWRPGPAVDAAVGAVDGGVGPAGKIQATLLDAVTQLVHEEFVLAPHCPTPPPPPSFAAMDAATRERLLAIGLRVEARFRAAHTLRKREEVALDPDHLPTSPGRECKWYSGTVRKVRADAQRRVVAVDVKFDDDDSEDEMELRWVRPTQKKQKLLM